MSIKNEIVKEIAVVRENHSGWRLELNCVSWNDNDPKYDLREWSPDHTHCGKGVTLREEDLMALEDAIRKAYEYAEDISIDED